MLSYWPLPGLYSKLSEGDDTGQRNEIRQRIYSATATYVSAMVTDQVSSHVTATSTT